MKTSRVLSFLVLFLAAAAAKSADVTWTYSPTGSTTNEQTIAGITITPTYEWKTTPYTATSSGMLQIGSSGKNAISVHYAFSAFPAKIKSVVVTGKTASGNSGNATVSGFIGTDPLDGSMSLTNAEGSITLTPPAGDQSGNLSLTISNPRANTANSSSQAIYLRSIVVIYQDPNSAGLDPGLEWATVFDEQFSGTSSTLSWAGNQFQGEEGDVDAARTDMDVWHGNNLYNAPGALRLGNASKHGWVRSPAISLSNGVSSATVKVTFPAIALHADAASALTFSVLDANGAELSIAGASPVTPSLPVVASPTAKSTVATELAGVGGSAQAFTFTAPAGFKLKFDASTAGNSNVALDDILVEQVIDPLFAPLAAPTGVAESDVGKYGFTVSWNGVADASGYEVWLDGAVAGSCASTSTSMTLTGLSDDTTYSVQVRALGDNLHCGDSPLSTAISVTTLADAQKIDFTVAGAPAAPVYAGAAVAFTVTAENESTHEAAEVSFSGIAGASFDSATGAFSWTTTESDIGSHTATFTSGTYSTNVTIEVLSPNRTATLFREDFSRFVTQWNGTSNLAAITNPPPDNAGWTFALATRAPSSLRIGKAINKNEGEAAAVGSALSPEIVLANNLSSGTVSLSFDAAAYFKQTTAMHVVVLDAETGETAWTSPVLHLDAIDAVIAKDSTLASVAEGVHTNATFSVPGVPERFQLLFETVLGAADHRLYLDTIVVSQTWDASIPALAAPVPAVGATGMDSVSVSWTAVTDAAGYDLEARRASDGSLAARASGVAGTSYTFTGLADGTAYELRLRALGDGVSSANSPWSEPAAAATAENPDRPDFAVSAGADGAVTAGTAKTFSVSASRNGTPVAVSYDGISPAPAGTAPSFRNGTFSWTPTDEDADKTFTATFGAGGSYATNVVFAVVPRPPLAAPEIRVVSLGVKDASLAWNDQSRATGYAVRLWRGTTDYSKPGVCFEDFFDHVLPKGWTGTGTPGSNWYNDRESPVQFEKSGDALVSKLHSAPVTNLAFRTELHGSAGETPSSWQLWASSGGTNQTAWTSIGGADVATGDRTYDFAVSDNYRRFKWTFTKISGNVGLGSIAAKHAGAGAKFVAGFGSAAAPADWGSALSLEASALRADTEYFLEVTATDGSSSLSSVFRFRTLEANKATMMILR